jgi:hypothetical protein
VCKGAGQNQFSWVAPASVPHVERRKIGFGHAALLRKIVSVVVTDRLNHRFQSIEPLAISVVAISNARVIVSDNFRAFMLGDARVLVCRRYTATQTLDRRGRQASSVPLSRNSSDVCVSG